MVRVTCAPASRRRRKRILNRAKGFWGDRKNHIRQSANAVMSALSFSYSHRKQKKSDFRSLWITRVGIGAKANGMSYSKLICGLKRAGSDVNRKMLAEMAIHDPEAFKGVVELAKKSACVVAMADIGQQIESMRSSLEQELRQAATSREIDTLKVKYLGKKGAVAGLMVELKGCTVDERPRIGALINQFKELITRLIEARGDVIATDELKKRLQEERLDVTLPGRGDFLGRRHVVMQVLDEAIDLLVGMGFSVQYGPEVETDFYNFEALNFSKNHPARQMHDTFYITSEWLLRTHTSNTQVRVMEGAVPPIRIIAPGKCYRNEDISARSHVLFHQIEGFYVDRDVTFADLLATLEELFTALLKREVKMRYRPSYFPFVEPGMEVDVSCIVCEGEGCPICKGSGWLEVAGAGMVHPEVLKFGGIDPEQFSGYAWGMGIERIAMLRFGIDDIRHFMENDLRFLQQF